jgi:hypothetical protein
MADITLCLAIHNHQPVGNFDWVLADAYERAYLPMLEALEQHPGVRIALHCSGSLLDWIRDQRAEYVDRVRALAARGQVEIMGGAYYEPILVMIPDLDKVGQVLKLSEAVRDELGFEPSGVWLAERAWEPHLALPLAEAGASYVILDDTHFRTAGFTDDEITGYYVTEEEGQPLKVFASSTFLRYALPWWPVDEVISWLLERAEERPGSVVAMGDDGEKFGLWPGTYDFCWGDGAWVERFFGALEENSARIRTVPPGEVAATQPPEGRVYLGCDSYQEMAGWALPPDAARALKGAREELQARGSEDALRFVRGGTWRGFLARYEEANQMHKKMLCLSRRVRRMPEGEEKREALDRVWAAQCNCGYWHGVFGGLYLSHIRAANYANLIAAEQIADRASLGEQGLTAEARDLDADGRDDVLLANRDQVLMFKPSYGGSLVEWDWRDRGLNLLNTMTRRPEAYHKELQEATQDGRLVLPGTKGDRVPDGVLVQDYDVGENLFYDWHRRASLLDHFVDRNADLEGFARSQYGEQGDFVTEPYSAALSKEEDRISLRMSREGGVWLGEQRFPTRVEKMVTLAAHSPALSVAYAVLNLSELPLKVRFGVELNWGLSGDRARDYVSLGETSVQAEEPGDHTSLAFLAVGSSPTGEGHGGVQIGIQSRSPANLYHFPIEVVSNSERGLERAYQGMCTLLWWDLALEPASGWENDLLFELG